MSEELRSSLQDLFHFVGRTREDDFANSLWGTVFSVIKGPVLHICA